MTTWLKISYGKIGMLCGKFVYFTQIWNLNLSTNGITEVCRPFIEHIVYTRSILWLDLSGNKLLALPQDISQGNFEKIWLHGNQFACNCDMLWMSSWLANSTTPSGDSVIQDYKQILCSHGKYKGMPIYSLNAELLGCLPTKLPSWGIGLIAGACTLIIFVVITVAVVTKRWNDVKFLLYLHFDILDKNDDDDY